MALRNFSPILILAGGLIELAGRSMSLSSDLSHEKKDADARVEQVQLHNDQLKNQLSENFSMDSLILDDEKRTFSFTLCKGGDSVEACEGTYECKMNLQSQ